MKNHFIELFILIFFKNQTRFKKKKKNCKEIDFLIFGFIMKCSKEIKFY